jgi:phosphate butyryltransferase
MPDKAPPAVASLADLLSRVSGRRPPPRVAIARSADAFVLSAAAEAVARGLAEPILIGDMARTRHIAQELGVPICDFESHQADSDASAVQIAVDLFKSGRAAFIMKGLVPTATLLKAILAKDTGVPRDGGILSHVTVFEAPSDGRLMLLSDAAVNIRPNLQRKVEIVKNALWVARRLGMCAPRVAMLAATEKVNYPAMPATLDADIIAKMGADGAFGDAVIAGPLSLDLAVSPASAAAKGFSGPVAGRAEVLIAPDIESGNVLYKALATMAGRTLASVVVGSRVPVVVPSRADSEASKLHSMALAAYLAQP